MLQLYLLGPPQVELNGAPLTFSRRKVLALLSYLAVNGVAQPRDKLAALFWPEYGQRAARKALRRDLSLLKQALDGLWLVVEGDSVGLRTGYWLDVLHFEQQAADGADDSSAVAAAVALYRDDFLAGFSLADAPDFDDWQRFQSESLRHTLAATLERLTNRLATEREYEAAISYARRWLALNVLHEPAHYQLMQLYAQAGQVAAALRQYETCVATLAAELGLAPGAESTALYEQIRSGALTATPANAPLPTRHHLPIQTTSFVGRKRELAEIRRFLLEEPSCRLLNLVGPGGVGKTRLALAAAEQMNAAFADGAFFVSLAPVSDPAGIVPAIAEALRLVFYGSTGPKDQLLDYLCKRQLLIIADNFEHLLSSAELLAEILRRAPEVVLLVTSRERLCLQEEWVYDVRGLPIPSDAPDERTQDLADNSAMQLFIQRAKQAETYFDPSDAELGPIRRICKLVEGMPLALELAAAWVHVLSCREIALEIENGIEFLTTSKRNLPERHRSLEAVFERSWQLLNHEQQRVFAMCSVFRGGFSRAAVVAVTNAVLATLAALVDKSLLHREATGRYVIHELARQFAQKKLASFSGSALPATRTAHTSYFLQWVNTQERALFGAQSQVALLQIQTDLENVHCAWRWACSCHEIELITTALEPLTRFYKLAALVHSGEQLFAATFDQLQFGPLDSPQRRLCLWRVRFYQAEMLYLLARYEQANAIVGAVYRQGLAENDLTLQAQAQILLGQIAYKLGRIEKARQCFEQGQSLCAQLNNDRLLAHALDNFGNILHILKEQDYGQAYHDQACQIAREHGDDWALATYLSNLGWMYYDRWEPERALAHFEQSLALQQRLSARYDMIETLLRIGQTHHRLYHDELALQHYHQAIRITEELGLHDASQAWLGIGNVYRRKGDWEQALFWLEKARQLLSALGKLSMLAECTSSMAGIHTGRGEYELARLRHQEALNLYMRAELPAAAAHQYCYLGVLYHRLGDYQAAQEHFNQALTLARTLDDRAFLPRILQEAAELAFQMQAYAVAQAYSDECVRILGSAAPEQSFFRQAEVTVKAQILRVRLLYQRGATAQALQQIETLLQSTDRLAEQAALYYAHWQLNGDAESCHQAQVRYRQLYAQEPYYQYQQRLQALDTGGLYSR